jgi:hypothetical protein
MTETDLGIGTIILALAVISLIDFFVVTVSVWAAAGIFRYNKKGRAPASRIALYSLKVGLIVSVPFVLALYTSHPVLEDILAKGPRLLLPLGLVFLVKTAAIFPEMKKVYGEGMKKTVNGYATAAYLIMCSWIIVILIFSMLVGFYGMLSAMMGLEGENVEPTLTGWQDLSPDLPGNYTASSSAYSLLFRNEMGEPIKIDSALVIDIISGRDCNVSSPALFQEVDVNGTFTLNATCPPVNMSAGDPYELGLEIYYTTLNTPLGPLFENDYVSGNACA